VAKEQWCRLYPLVLRSKTAKTLLTVYYSILHDRLRNPKPFCTATARTNKFRQSFITYAIKINLT